jgi:ring-1,2-phenylacetyl-CoA epoxidase subunit PaaC
MPRLSRPHSAALQQYAIRLGDDALIHGHRLSEWCSRGPFLEEDLALTNVALDFLGRARLFYGYAAELADSTYSEDDLAYRRDTREFTNALIYELPRGDFAFTMARQFLIDVFNLAFLTPLQTSADAQLAAIAGKAVKESRYHLRRSQQWMLRLGLGTAESHQRLQEAINELWGYTAELFESDALNAELCAAGIAVDLPALKPAWESQVREVLTAADTRIPEDDWQAGGGRQGKHTEWLGHLLCELQFLQRAYPGLEW